MARIRQLTSQALYEKEGGACKAQYVYRSINNGLGHFFMSISMIKLSLFMKTTGKHTFNITRR